MKNNWLEKGLNDKLGDYGSPMDLEEAWKALEAQRRPQKKKRKLLGWWIFGCSILLGVLGYFVFGKNNSNTQQVATKIEIAEQETKNHIINSKNINSIEKQDLKTINETNTGQKVLNNNLSFSKTVDTGKGNASSLKAKKTNTIQIQNPNYQVESIFNYLSSSSNLLEKFEDTSLDKKTENNILDASISKMNPSIFTKEEIGKIELLPFVNVLLLNSTLENNSVLDLSKSKKYFTLRKPRSTHYFGIESGYGFMTKGKTNQEETSLDAFSLNVFFRKKLSKNLYLKTGLNYNQFTNKIERIQSQTSTQTLDNQLITVNQFNNGTVDNIYGTADVELTENTQYEIYNRYSFVSVPVLIGMEISPMGRSSFQIESGISASVFSKFDGNYFADVDSQDLTSFENLDLKKQGVMNGLFAAQWNYVPFENQNNWEFFLKFQRTVQINEISNSDELNIQKFSAQQLFLGTQIRF